MKVLFLGGIFDENMEIEILKKSKSAVQYAANKLQWNLIDGLLQIDDMELEVLSAPLIGAFPKEYEGIRFEGKSAFYKNKTRINYVEFSNLWAYRNVSRKNNLIKDIKDFALEKNDNKNIIVYSTHTPYLQAAVYAKQKDPSIHICLVVPDLPQYMNLNKKRTFIYDWLKKIDINSFNKNLNYVDSFVLITEPMKNLLNVGKRPFVVVEGIVNAETSNNEVKSADDVMTVVYTGTLNRKFGVVDLVKAFHKVSLKNVYLKICGRGDSEDVIKEYALKDERIKFLGQLSNEEVVKLQKSATVLVNPRQNNEEFTKYSFPSKNMEYLLTGRPIIAYKLDGIPYEYDNYFNYIEDDSIELFTKMIEKVLYMSEEERINFGSKARAFVLGDKNNYKASKRIIDMIRQSRGG